MVERRLYTFSGIVVVVLTDDRYAHVVDNPRTLFLHSSLRLLVTTLDATVRNDHKQKMDTVKEECASLVDGISDVQVLKAHIRIVNQHIDGCTGRCVSMAFHRVVCRLCFGLSRRLGKFTMPATW